jgi:hypothetical protein
MTYFTYAEWSDIKGNWEKSYDWDAHIRRSLVFQYGHERANQIIKGKDPATQADIARWNNLGNRGGQAA